jgi:pyruvate,water dikinase
MDSQSLQGIPCSKGKVTGEVLIINNAMEAKNAKDKILVTKMTDPGWVFLLASAKGIIAEKGSLLSHTAIISRELKIPSIVGVDNALDILKNNDIVSMDGNTGIIEILR